MIRGLRKRFGCGIVASLGLLLLMSAVAYGSGSVNWNTELVIPLSEPSLDFSGSWTTFSGSYGWENGYGVSGSLALPLPDTAGGALSVNAQIERDLVINWPVGTWGVTSSASFALQTPSLSGFSATANVTAFGTSTTATFNLYSFQGAYATRLDVKLAGGTQEGWGFSATGTFGDPRGSSCNLDFTGMTIGLEAFPWGCVRTDVAFDFGCDGYEKTTIDVDIDPWDGVFVLDGTLEFTLNEKTLSLIPYLTVGQQCIWIHVGIEPQGIGLGATTLIDQLVIKGLGITDCEIGAITFSTISSVAGLYRSKGASEIDLHVSSYYLDLAPDAFAGAWLQTDYTMVVTIQSNASTFIDGYTSSQLMLDFYFGTPVGTLFDFALFTAIWHHELSDAFSYTIAVQLDPTGVEHLIKLGFTASAALP